MFHGRTVKTGEIEKTLGLNEFPSPAVLWAKYREWKGLPPENEPLVLQDYYSDGSGRGPRYYQANAVNAAIQAVARGEKSSLARRRCLGCAARGRSVQIRQPNISD